ncbi:MAG: ABC transporter permease subunit [Nitrososphaerota archaeon]|nr:ABC transporter permease subunit [Candidatus Bathyarchaeota archaeon]MDW8048728.1 ABC transporter permease subunit [Nitrososphaerota archaeon]
MGQISANKNEGSGSSRILRIFDLLSSKRSIRFSVYLVSLSFFIIFILVPPLVGILQKFTRVWEIYKIPTLLERANNAILCSFLLAFIVSTLDMIAGLPLAWFIVRSRSRLINIIDTFVDIPFLIPTAALGYSASLFWSKSQGLAGIFGMEELVPPGFMLVLLLHFIFSYPVIVRVMVGELLNYTEIYEVAAKTLGAQPFTSIRTVTLPLLKPALVASFLLSFARSLSETGATVMVAGQFENGSVFIFNNQDKECALVYVSLILITSSIILFFLIKLIALKLKIPIRHAWPNLERKLSSHPTVKLRDSLTIAVFLLIVISPSIYVALPLIYALENGTVNKALAGIGPWSAYWSSISLSYSIGFISTVINILAGLPMAILIARRKAGQLSSLLDSIVNIPIIVPSIALGVSLRFFWESVGFLNEFWVLILSHATITYPYFVMSMSAAIMGIDKEMEEVAFTLGAKPFTIFRRITFPLTKYSVFSGAVLVFTRCVGETGAAKAAAKTLKTTPVLLVEWIIKGVVSPSESALGVGILILICFIVLLILRVLIRGGKR